MTAEEVLTSKKINLMTFGEGKPRVLITAGVHGGELTPIFIAHHLIKKFYDEYNYAGQTSIIPKVNPNSTFALERNNINDDKNINSAGNYGNSHNQHASSDSDQIADAIIEIAEEHDFVIDLHSGSKGRYLPLAYFNKRDDLKFLRQTGIHMAIRRNESSKAHGTNKKTICYRIRKEYNVPALALEIGAGHTIYTKDVLDGIMIVERILRSAKKRFDSDVKHGTLNFPVKDYSRDIVKIKNRDITGAVHITKALGEKVDQGETLGYCLTPRNKTQPIRSEVSGTLIYKRVAPLVGGERKETLFIIAK